MRVFVARSRHKNAVELNRGTVSYGILIQPEPHGKHFRGGVGGAEDGARSGAPHARPNDAGQRAGADMMASALFRLNSVSTCARTVSAINRVWKSGSDLFRHQYTITHAIVPGVGTSVPSMATMANMATTDSVG
jgi:hypothetical protein